MDAYSIANMQRIFVANGVVQPDKWFGHAPVYPFTTLAALSPLATVGMVPAAYILTVLSGALLALAFAALMRYAANDLDLGLGWRLLIVGLCGCGPLLAMGFNMGNVSLAASALCFLAFVRRKSGSPWMPRSSPWIPGTALALAFLLKPHLGLWAGIGMLLLPERAARAVAARAIALATGFAVLSAAAMAAMGTLGLEVRSYLAMLSAETSAGASMSATSREVLPVPAQITSLDSIMGFWIANHSLRVALTCTVLLGLALLVVRQTRRVDSERGALLAIAAWGTLGMLATYHRAHDAVLLLLAVPWVVDRVRRAPRAWHAWATLALYCAMSVSVDLPAVTRWVAAASQHSMAAFVLLRQVAIADLLLLPVLLLAMERERASRRGRRSLSSDEAREMAAAA